MHIEDRGYQFADGVYEVITAVDGKLIDLEAHLERLDRSLSETRIKWPVGKRALIGIFAEIMRRNRLQNAVLYLQITRGHAPRDHGFPADEVRPALVVTARRPRTPDAAQAARGVAIITLPDTRWKRPDIKSIALLPNVMGKQLAREAGAFEAWFVDDRGMITEGTSTNAWIVDEAGAVITRPADRAILNGITRRTVIGLAREMGIQVIERPFSLEEAYAASEAFLTSTTSFVLPVTEIDGQLVGRESTKGVPGPVAAGLVAGYGNYLTALGAAV